MSTEDRLRAAHGRSEYPQQASKCVRRKMLETGRQERSARTATRQVFFTDIIL